MGSRGDGMIERVLQKHILIVVKTYPNPSSTYGETVCCAGVDLETGQWVRIYPITFRRLAERQFEKFQVIRCEASRRPSDNRPESWRVNQDTIKLVGERMPAGPRGWTKRMSLLPQPAGSLEEIYAAQRATGTSVAMVRPKEIIRLVRRRAEPWTEAQRAYLRQQHLDLGEEASRELSELEQIPYSFAYQFRCDDSRCTKPHTLSILDWELGAAYRRWRRAYGNGWEAKLRQKFEQELPATDLHLVVGNLAKRHHTFVIIGLVRPPRSKVADSGFVEQTLDLMGKQRAVTSVGVGLEAEEADAFGSDDRQELLELFPDEG